VRFRPDIVIFATLLSGSTYAVWTQVDHDPIAPYARVALGGTLDDVVLEDPTGVRRSLSSLYGDRATVLYFWSVGCPCVDQVERRIKDVMARYPESKGVRFVAIDSEPEDTKEQVIDKMGTLHAEYYMLLDPEQRLARPAGATQALTFLVLDSDRRVRYRGALDDDLVKPTTSYLASALEAVLAGKAPPVNETKGEGCAFSGWAGDCPLPLPQAQ
jgi:hypothetical protein